MATLKSINSQLRTANRTRREVEERIRRLERAKDDLRNGGNGRVKMVSGRPSRAGRQAPDPHVQAGPKNLARMTRAFARKPVMSQVEASERSGCGTGTTTHAIRALEADGVISWTGEYEGRSKVYRADMRRVRSRVTRRRPGE